jgi:peptidoglycan/LPS O-acetylase OafA/YrhL
VFVGEASYCLYLLHFNLWNLIHDRMCWIGWA